jgi:hypothetical protein
MTQKRKWFSQVLENVKKRGKSWQEIKKEIMWKER